MTTKLTQIQNELKVPKSKWNDFSKFNYRSCEDILEAVKPILLKHDCVLTIADEIKECGGRIYIEATATLMDLKDGSEWAAKAYAREAETKKGMDDSQITGCASSYARKYALAGLFLLDDGNDADAQDNRQTDNRTERMKRNSSKFAIDFDSIREQCEMIDDLESLTDYYKQITAGNPTEKQIESIKKIFSERRKKIQNGN